MGKRFQVNQYDLLGQAEMYPPRIVLPGAQEPKLDIAWGSFHQNFFSNIPVFFQRTRLTVGVPLVFVLRDCRVENPAPRGAIVLAALVQILFLLIPWPDLPMSAKRNPAFDNTQLTWSGPVDDLPLLNMPRAKKTAPRSKNPADPPPTEGADAFHPRQRIITDPSHPTHPRQTLVNPAAPLDAPKILPDMPNVVHLASVAAPPRPRLEISEQTLRKLRPKAKKTVATTDVPSLDLPNLEQKPADVSLMSQQNGPAKPKLEINAGSTPRLGPHKQDGELATAPEVAPSASNAPASSAGTLIALSASPAPPSPVVPVPDGNLSARVAISPEGKKTGVPGGAPAPPNSNGGTTEAASNSAGGANTTGIVISGGNPKPNSSVSGLGGVGKFSIAKPQAYIQRPDPNAPVEDDPVRTGPPNFALLPPGSPPEQIFSRRRVYAMNVNMPNFNSATGSWIIHFSELRLAVGTRQAGEVASPVPVHKVDPKYPSTMVEERIEGEVILYGVIRQNGTVDSIQLVRGIDERLNANAMSAFKEWKFEPATREGHPVDLEAIVHIPFHAPPRD
ncbi:MAG TPA: energy transducer TonB [Methylomirabilota bacterium]|nr:energy transducer TonB [Methylomirabilota bacterium]